MPAVFFDPNNLERFAPPTDIWIENPEDLDITSHYIHDQVVEKLGKFLAKATMPYLRAGYILEDENETRYLVLDEPRASGIKSIVEKFDDPEGLAILDVLNKYKISKVIERKSKVIKDGDSSKMTGSSEIGDFSKSAFFRWKTSEFRRNC